MMPKQKKSKGKSYEELMKTNKSNSSIWEGKAVVVKEKTYRVHVSYDMLIKAKSFKEIVSIVFDTEFPNYIPGSIDVDKIEEIE
jgi:hypothetical protein